MKPLIIYNQKSIGRRIIASLILFVFLVTGITYPSLRVYTQGSFYLPPAGTRINLSPAFNPPILKGIKVHTDNPFRFDFILDKGDSSSGDQQLKDESTKLIKYFLASLTIPEKDLWVNLSPYEKDRIIPPSFGLTEMGRDLLAQDYMLKQITASLIYPEDKLGKRFWKRIYEEASKRFGTTNISVNTFNKVWIIPEKALVYENAKAGTAYVVESRLKVMLEEDYLALSHNDKKETSSSNTNKLGSKIVREIVIPELTKEVNEGKNFVQLRQVYQSLILATWYKKKIKDSILSQVYADKNKVVGINIGNPQEKEKIYKQYLQAFKKGVYNYIKEEIDPVTREAIPKKYFSGGMDFLVILAMVITPHMPDVSVADKAILSVNLVVADQSMSIPKSKEAFRINPLLALRDPMVKMMVAHAMEFYGHMHPHPIDAKLVSHILDTLEAGADDPGIAMQTVYDQVTDPRRLDSPIGKAYNNLEYRADRKLDLNMDLIGKDLGNGVIANVGAGDNMLSERIASRIPTAQRVIGMDIRKRAKTSYANPKVEYIQQDSPNHLPLPDASVDTVLLNYVLHHAGESLPNLLGEIFRILKPGGRVVALEDTWLDGGFSQATAGLMQEFHQLNDLQKHQIYWFNDWFSHHLVAGYFDMPMANDFRPMEDWEREFERMGFETLRSDDLGFPAMPFSQKMPQGLIIFSKPNQSSGISMARHLFLQAQNERQKGEAESAASHEQEGFNILRDWVLRDFEKELPMSVATQIQPVEVNLKAPVRLDFSSALGSDRYVISMEKGGRVLNAAITLDGEKPINVRANHINAFEIQLLSKDGNKSAVIRKIEDLNGIQVDDPLNLLKLALFESGIIPYGFKGDLESRLRQLGGGIQIETEVRGIARGSGLGISGILSATLVKALFAVTGRTLSDSELILRGYRLEQLNGSLGGWQDPAGALTGGVKWITSKPDDLAPSIHMMQLSPNFLEEFKSRMFLVYTGQSRASEDQAKRAIIGYVTRDSQSYGALKNGMRIGDQMHQALVDADVTTFGSLLTEYSQQLLLQRGPEASTPFINHLVDSISNIADAKLSGAGGGGVMIVISKPGKTEELKGRLEILLQGTDAKISLYDFDAQGIEMEIRKHDSQSDSSSTFDSEIKRLWDERLSAGLLKNDPNDFQHQRVGNFWIRISPPRDHIPLEQTPVDDGEKFDFTKVDSRTRLMDATFGNHTVSLIANNDPILPYHFLAVPELLQKREQKIEEMDIDLILQLISKSRDPHLKFTFNSKGAGASVDHIHFKGFYYHESQLPIEEAKTNFLSIKDGVRISMLDGFPAKGFVFEYEGIENSDKVAHVSGELIRHLQEESIPFNILVTHHKLFILPRSNQGVIVNHHNYIFGSVEMSGEIRASLEESFTSDQIAQFIGSATIGQKLFDQAKTFFDQAQLTRNGGIDLTADKAFSVQNNGHAIKFHIDPAMLQQLQNAPGFTPVIINIQPMTDLRLFLGLDSNNNLPAARSS